MKDWDPKKVVADNKISEDFVSELEDQLSKPHNMVPGINIRVVQNDNSAKDGPTLRKAVTAAAAGVNGRLVRFQRRHVTHRYVCVSFAECHRPSFG